MITKSNIVICETIADATMKIINDLTQEGELGLPETNDKVLEDQIDMLVLHEYKNKLKGE